MPSAVAEGRPVPSASANTCAPTAILVLFVAKPGEAKERESAAAPFL